SRLMAIIKIGGPTEPKIDRHEHQPCAMRDCHGEGPEPQLRRPYPRHEPRMASVDQPEDTEPDNQHAGSDLDLPLPFDERDEQGEGKDHHEHGQEMARCYRGESSAEPPP